MRHEQGILFAVPCPVQDMHRQNTLAPQSMCCMHVYHAPQAYCFIVSCGFYSMPQCSTFAVLHLLLSPKETYCHSAARVQAYLQCATPSLHSTPGMRLHRRFHRPSASHHCTELWCDYIMVKQNENAAHHIHVQAGVRLPGDAGVDVGDIMLTNASAIHRYFMNDQGKVVHPAPDPLPPGALFVERAALVEHMYFEAQRLEPER